MTRTDLAVVDAGESGEIAQAKWTKQDWTVYHKLTEKQRAFVMEYPKDFANAKAAQRAGYKGDKAQLAVVGSRLIRHPKVNPLIRKLTAATADELGITREWLLKRIEEVAEKATLGAPKFVGKDGEIARDENGDVVYEWSPQGAARALELLAKLRGDMIEKKEINMIVVELKINDVELGDLV